MDETVTRPRSEWATGWPVVLMGFIGMLWMNVSTSPLAVLLKPIAATWGWSRGATAVVVLLNSLVVLVVGPFVGALVRKYGPYRMSLVGAPLAALALFVVGRTGPNLMAWYVGWVFFSIAHLGCNIVVWASAITSTFKKHRGAALAIAFSGLAAGSAILPMLTLTLYKKYGIAEAYAGLGALLLITSLPFPLTHYLRLRRRPLAEAMAAPIMTGGHSFMAALRSLKFWHLTFGMMTAGAVMGSITIHIVSLMTDKGMSIEKATWVMSLMGPAVLFGRLVTGAMLDRCTARQVILPIYAFPIAACFILANFNGAVALAIAAVTFTGVAMGAEGDLLAYFVGRYFGTTNFSSIYPAVFGLYATSFSAFPVLAGVIYDRLRSYSATYMALGVMLLFGTVAMLLLGDYPDRDRQAAA